MQLMYPSNRNFNIPSPIVLRERQYHDKSEEETKIISIETQI